MKFWLNFYVILITFFIAACAQPDYLSEVPKQNNSATKPTEDCPYTLNKSKACVTVEWLTAVSTESAGEILVTIPNQEVQSLSALLWMPSMGHGSAPVKLEKVAANTFKITNMYFIMPGDWEIRIHVQNDSDLNDDLTISVLVQ